MTNFNRISDNMYTEMLDVMDTGVSEREAYRQCRSEGRFGSAPQTRRPVKQLSGPMELHLKDCAKLARTPASNRQIAFLAQLIYSTHYTKNYIEWPAGKPLSKSDASELIDRIKRAQRY